MVPASTARWSRSRVLAAAVGAAACAAVAQADLVSYTTSMSGPAEAPPNASPGTGTAHVDIDTVAHTLRIRIEFTGLLGTTTAAHVHAPTAVPGEGTASVATQIPSFSGFPLGVTSGTYDLTFDTLDAATWNPSFVAGNGGTPAGAEAAFAAALAQGRAYMNVHSSMFPGGEIRGFMQLVPAPGAGAALALAGVLASRRRRG